MKPAFKRKIVKALLSGKYKQVQDSLKADGGYCCLGVMRHILDPKDKSLRDGANYNRGKACVDGDGNSLPEEYLHDGQLEKIGMSHEEQQLLSELNDLTEEDEDSQEIIKMGVPFPVIAGFIQEYM